MQIIILIIWMQFFSHAHGPRIGCLPSITGGDGGKANFTPASDEVGTVCYGDVN